MYQYVCSAIPHIVLKQAVLCGVYYSTVYCSVAGGLTLL